MKNALSVAVFGPDMHHGPSDPFPSRMLKTALPCMMFCHFCIASTSISHEKTDVLVWELQGADIWYLKFAAKGRQCPILT